MDPARRELSASTNAPKMPSSISFVVRLSGRRAIARGSHRASVQEGITKRIVVPLAAPKGQLNRAAGVVLLAAYPLRRGLRRIGTEAGQRAAIGWLAESVLRCPGGRNMWPSTCSRRFRWAFPPCMSASTKPHVRLDAIEGKGEEIDPRTGLNAWPKGHLLSG